MFLIKSNHFNSSSPPPSPPLITQLVISYLQAIWYTTQIERANIHEVRRKGRYLHLRYEYVLAGNTFQIHILKERPLILTSLLLEMPLCAPPSLTAQRSCSVWMPNTHLRQTQRILLSHFLRCRLKGSCSTYWLKQESLRDRENSFLSFFFFPSVLGFFLLLFAPCKLSETEHSKKNWHLLEKVALLKTGKDWFCSWNQNREAVFKGKKRIPLIFLLTYWTAWDKAPHSLSRGWLSLLCHSRDVLGALTFVKL